MPVNKAEPGFNRAADCRWERQGVFYAIVRSVANLTHRDGVEFLELAPKIPVRSEVTAIPLPEANAALARLRNGQVTGALVLVPNSV